MSNAFDPYYQWLGISPAEQPPNHYRLLGISLYESNPDVISNAADRQMAHVRTFQSGKHSQESQKLLNELSAARVVLLDAEKRAAYETQLRAKLFTPMPGYPMGMGPMGPMGPMGVGPMGPMGPMGVGPMGMGPMGVSPMGTIPPQTPMGVGPMGTIPPQTPMGVGPMGTIPPQTPMGVGPMGTISPQTSMGAGMRGVVPPQTPQPPQPPQTPAAGGSVGGQPSVVPPLGSNAGRKYKKTQKKDSTMLYVGIGVLVCGLLGLLFLFAGGNKKHVAENESENEVQNGAQTEGIEEINPDDFTFGMTESAGETPVVPGKDAAGKAAAAAKVPGTAVGTVGGTAEETSGKKTTDGTDPAKENPLGNTEPGGVGTDENEEINSEEGLPQSLEEGKEDSSTKRGERVRTGKKSRKSGSKHSQQEDGSDAESDSGSDSDEDSDENSEGDADPDSETGSEGEIDEEDSGTDGGEKTGDSVKNKKGSGKNSKKASSTGKKEEGESSVESDPETAPPVTEDDIRKLGSGAGLCLEPKRTSMLKFYGGSKSTKTALTSGVEWLLDKQLKDKEHVWWCFDHTLLPNNKRRFGSKNYTNQGFAKENLVSATSLALMAIVGSGEISPKDKANVQRAVKFLQYCSKPVGDVLIPLPERESAKKMEASLVVEENSYDDFHPHAWGTIAVCDFVALEKVRSEKRDKVMGGITEFAQALLRHVTRQQNPDGGFPKQERGLTVDCTLVSKTNSHISNVESTVWNLMAMKAGKEAGLSVPNESIAKATEYLNSFISQTTRRYKDFTEIPSSDIRDLRCALFGIQLLGSEFPTYDESVVLAAKILKIEDISQLQENVFMTMYMRDLRGQTWDSWRENVCAQYLKDQSDDKFEAGSWFYDGEKINSEGGRLYCTALATMVLESYYRYEPLRPLDEYTTSLEATLNGDAAENGEMAPAFPIARPAENPENGENGKTGNDVKLDDATAAVEFGEKEPEDAPFRIDIGNEQDE